MPDNQAILLIGSNIDPEININKALDLLKCSSQIKKMSGIWITEAVGSKGPDFLNVAVQVNTGLTSDKYKKVVISPIETELGRVRSNDKYAPRTIDIDIIIFNGKVLDTNIWNKLFIALPVSEIIPVLKNESTGEILIDTVEKLKSSAKAELL
jgi:2-amino-4-hydroxy-6-hydroxymethyldihydropteridine diphosphokinase